MEKGEKKGRKGGVGELEEKGLSRWRKDRDEKKERESLIERAIMGLARNLTLGKFPEIHKDDSS